MHAGQIRSPVKRIDMIKHCRFLLLLIGACFTTALSGQSSTYTVDDFAESITPQDLRMYLSVLASDQLEGRETGTEGNEKAAQFIASQFNSFGIPPYRSDGSYYQDVEFTRTDWGEVALLAGDKTYKQGWDFLCMKQYATRQEVFDLPEIIFAGYGIVDPKHNDYKGLDVRGKAVMIYEGEPSNAKGVYCITGSKEPSEWSDSWRKKMEAAREQGAAVVLLIANDFKKLTSQTRRFNVGPSISLGSAKEASDGPALAILSSTMARELMGGQVKEVISARDRINKGKRPKTVILKTPFTFTARMDRQQITGSNVLGYIEGIDPELKDELVVITAHFDHLGKRGDDIFNGANDNGSGTSTVLDIAQAFALAKQKGVGPRRSVLCMLVTGEEKGLLGSEYYAENPVFPLEKTVVNVNVDMVGRIDKKHEGNPDYIYVIGSDRLSTDLHRINEETNARTMKLELDYTYNAKDDPNRYYQRSDHYNFAERGVPAIFFFNGSHEDYHRPSDTIEKIDFETMAKIGKLVFYTSWELANRDERIRVDGQEE